MKITRRILQEIIKEEVSGVLFEKKLSDGNFVGLSGYKFHTNPNDWRVVDSPEEAEVRANLMNIPKDGKADEDEVLSQELIAADDRGFLKKFYDKALRKFGRFQDKYYFRQDKNIAGLGTDITPEEIGKHASKVFAELILRYILGSPDGSGGEGYLFNTFFYGKSPMSFEEFQKYVARKLFRIQAKNSKSQQGMIDIGADVTKPFIDIIQWDEVADQMSEEVWNDLLAQAENFAQKDRTGEEENEEKEQLSELKRIIRKEMGNLLSEGVKFHLKNKIPINENIFRPGSTKYFELFAEVRKLSKNGLYKLDENEKYWINETDIGEFALYEGKKVPLDFPMPLIEAKKSSKKKKNPPLNKPTLNSGGGKKYKVFVRDPKTGNIKKVTFGDKKGGLKGNWNSAEARASFASRHNCAEKKDKTKAGYWACRAHKYFGKNVPGRFW